MTDWAFYILSFGRTDEVLKPQNVREEVVTKLEDNINSFHNLTLCRQVMKAIMNAWLITVQ